MLKFAIHKLHYSTHFKDKLSDNFYFPVVYVKPVMMSASVSLTRCIKMKGKDQLVSFVIWTLSCLEVFSMFKTAAIFVLSHLCLIGTTTAGKMECYAIHYEGQKFLFLCSTLFCPIWLTALLAIPHTNTNDCRIFFN